MKATLTSISLIVVFLFAATSCKKYEEGPAISLRSKKARVANTWKVDKAFSNGNDVTSLFSGDELEITKDGDITSKSGSSTTKGTWEFSDNKEEITFTFDNDDEIWEILKLKEKEFWIQQKAGDVELQLAPK